ncbi:MAG: hypothetical protein KKA62_01380 [Nanoarchaeota archaeon]|nr:hypothetical protein [Nanoarchaeota archaeon]MBU1976585.1 hypothetical protein [Nanoarchaeota archaeon]
MRKIDVRKELTTLLDECGIEDFELNASDQVLIIKYKEDFDRFFPKLGADPQVHKPGYGTPYHFGKVAFFDYEGWQVKGWITIHKPEK